MSDSSRAELEVPLDASRASLELRASLNRGEATLSGLSLEGLAYRCAALHRGAPTERRERLLLVTPTEQEAAQLARALCGFLGEGAARAWGEASSPFSTLTPSRAQEGARLSDLTSLASGQWPQPLDEQARSLEEARGLALVVPICALAASCPAPASLRERRFTLQRDEQLTREDLIKALSAASYERVEQVRDHGTFSVRGDLVDLYPAHHPLPYRLSFWGDELQELRAFHPATQRPLEVELERLEISAAHPLRLDERGLRGLIEGIYWAYDDLCEQASEAERAQLSQAPLKRWESQLSQGMLPIGIEACAPRATEEGGAWLLDYLSAYFEAQPNEQLTCVLYEPARALERLAHVQSVWASELEEERERVVYVPLSEHLLSAEALMSGLEGLAQRLTHSASDLSSASFSTPLYPHLALRAALDAMRGSPSPFEPLFELLERWRDEGRAAVVACAHEGQRERLERLLGGFEPQRDEAPIIEQLLSPRASLTLTLAPLAEGWEQHEPLRGLLTACELLSQPLPTARTGEAPHKALELTQALESPYLEDPNELTEGQHVVHAEYGVAIFRGIEQITDEGARGGPTTYDCARLEFAKGELVLLPVYRLHLLQRFVGVPRPRLGSPREPRRWAEQRERAREEANEQAYALLELYAERAQQEGVSYSSPDERFRAFEEAFPYTETPDQLRAIRRVIDEMCKPKPMDHLLCGDVGFGKTEVAMRAAMKALLDGKQVAMLAPTTILVSQHTKSFKERFKGTPYKVAQLSRFVSEERKREVLRELAEGKIHVIIGTQSLLQKRVVIPELGLLILDEEHRFGVKDKERLKEVRANLDVLSMTATPIPRTLHMSLTNVRSMSILSTPPRDRLSVYTQLSRLSPALVREACLSELRRGGQVFYVYNRVETIQTKRAWLESLLPGVSVDVAHGKMRPDELEEVMGRFMEGRSQVLVCTTLIETGIDIPRANTMFIDKAHTFGLAQLYQLRGRVGRSHERARCYLLVPSEELISEQARERLKVLQRFTDLGSGFHIANHDLELRGAGDLLGTKQNGASQAVGLELYNEMIQEAIKRKQGRRLEERFEPDIKLPATEQDVLPSEYIESARERLVTYRRLSACRTLAQLEPLVEELRERFGSAPESAEATLLRWRVLVLARELGVELLSYERGLLTLQLHIDSRFPLGAMRRVSPRLGVNQRGAARLTDLQDGLWQYQVPERTRSEVWRSAEVWLTLMHDHLPELEVDELTAQLESARRQV